MCEGRHGGRDRARYSGEGGMCVGEGIPLLPRTCPSPPAGGALPSSAPPSPSPARLGAELGRCFGGGELSSVCMDAITEWDSPAWVPSTKGGLPMLAKDSCCCRLPPLTRLPRRPPADLAPPPRDVGRPLADAAVSRNATSMPCARSRSTRDCTSRRCLDSGEDPASASSPSPSAAPAAWGAEGQARPGPKSTPQPSTGGGDRARHGRKGSGA